LAKTTLKVALIHDWLTGMRGGEKCLEVLCRFFPDADLFTIFHDKGAMSPLIEGMNIRTSWIMRLPLAAKHFRMYLPLFPAAMESFNFSEYDLLISTSHCVAKGAIPSPQALHLSYVHTPMRYIWEMYPHYLGSSANPVKRALGPLIASYLRQWDITSSNHVDYFIANSHNVARRIQRHYRREATVIHPPVETETFINCGDVEDYYLIVTALVPYKQVHLAVEAFNQSGRRLLIVGSGPEKEKLTAAAKANISFLPFQQAPELKKLYSRCQALVFPGEEDFGIVPLEAQSCGRPVIAYGRGGALETVVPPESGAPATGLFFETLSAASLNQAVERFEKLTFDPQACRENALKFSKAKYTTEMAAFINARIEEKFRTGSPYLSIAEP